MARFAFGITAALAALSLATALTQPDESLTGTAVAALPVASNDTIPPPVTPTTLLAIAPTTVVTAAPPTTAPPAPAVTAAPRVTTPPTPTSAPVYATSSKRESCGWSWDATHFDDGSLNEVTILLDAPRRPSTPVTMTAKPGASLIKTFATWTDANGQASMVVSLSNDKRDWSLTIGAQFPGSSCDARSFTIAY